MKSLLLDMDNVLADALGQFIRYYEAEFGTKVTRESLNGKPEIEGFPSHADRVYEYAFQKGFFRGMDPVPGSQAAVKRLAGNFRIHVVSAAMEFPQSLSEKFEWLGEHFPYLHWKQFVFCGTKSVVNGDIMVDDLPENLERFSGERLLFSQPHNLQFNTYHRLDDWVEAEEHLMRIRE
jgi:5'(3')-deoxyribonucleotidase